MEINELKNAWTKLDAKNIDSALISTALQKQYKSRINKIILPEVIGMIVCLLAAGYIGYQIKTLETISLQAVAVAAVLLLLVIPILSFASFVKLNAAGNVQKPHVEVLRDFAVQKLRFYKVQKINTILCYLLLVALVIVISGMFGNDISDSTLFWIFSFTGGYCLLHGYSLWVQKYYKKNLLQMEELLGALD